MKFTTILIFLLQLSATSFAGTLTCSTTDLASADILSIKMVQDVNFEKPILVSLVNDFSDSQIEFTPTPMGGISYSIKTFSDYEEQHLVITYDASDLKKDITFKATSVASQALNLDTLYTKCEWRK